MNKYQTYLSKEDNILQAVGNYIKLQYPKVFWFHPVNEGKRTKFEQFKAKATHIKAGVPDILIFKQKEITLCYKYCGLAIELKSAKGKTTTNQLNCLSSLRDNGWKVEVCYGTNEAIKVIKEYLG